jgi:flagellar assembly protein FliH
VQQAGSATDKGGQGRIEVFEYPAGSDASLVPEWSGWGSDEEGADGSSSSAKGRAAEPHQRAEFERRLGEETRRSLEAGREQGRLAEREAQAAARMTAERERAQHAAALVESFTRELERYLLKVEHEVVKLALAVAARILRREAQMDPLLLTGAVRVALGQLAASTEVRLRVPAGELELWREAIALLPNPAVKPTVLAGEGMLLGDCRIETGMGSVDLGIRAQLGEIERGFFDRAGSIASAPVISANSSPVNSQTEACKAEAAELASAGRESR